MLHGIRTRVRSLLRRNAVEREMEAELREHLDHSVELHIRRGLDPDAARLAARRDLGNLAMIAEEAREARGARWLDDLRRDMRHAIRALGRTPGFSAVVVITLAFGFGVNGALFSILRGAMHPTSMPEPERWVNVPDLWSYADYEYLRDSVQSMTYLSAHAEQDVLVGRDSEVQDALEVSALFVSDGYFAGLRGRPAMGRLFGAEELSPPAGEPVAILGHRFWTRRYASDSSVIGRSIRLAGGQAFTVIGVMARDFAGQSLRPPDLWLPLGARQRLPGIGNQIRSFGDDSWFGSGGREFLFIAGRIAPGASLETVRAELALRIAQRASPDDTTRARDVTAGLHTADRSGISSGAEVGAAGLLLGAAVSVLLIASITVANLMLARAASRRREIGVRLALGASRTRVVRAWLTECFLLSGAAAVLGLVLSWWTVRAFVLSDVFQSIARDMDTAHFGRLASPDAGVVLYLAVLTLLSTLVFGLAPVLRATRKDPLTTMRDTGGAQLRRDRVPLRNGLVVSQVALTMVLLVASGMLVRGLLHATAIDPGFDRHGVIVLTPHLMLRGYDSARARLFVDDLHVRAGAIAGVGSVTRGNVPILNTALARLTRPGTAGSPGGSPIGQFNAVSESFFTTLGIDIVRGRSFTPEEVRREAPVVVLSQTTARLLFPGEEAIGQVLSVRPTVRGISELSRSGARPAPGLFENARVVGVAADAQMSRLGTINRRYAYIPGDYWDLMVRRDPRRAQEVDERLRMLAREIDPDVVLQIRSLEQIIWTSGGGYLEIARLTSAIAGIVGVLSMLMAVVGLFGLTAFDVAQRTREFGVRMALGAHSGNVVRLVAAQSLRLVAIGAIIGLVGAAAGGGVLRNLLFGVNRVDPLAYGSVALLLAGVSFVACYIPARRVTRVDPMIALRTD
ncbi:MAG TPA: ADOP family duplicated permease [Gemmatimonadaceae bacterium]